MRSSSLLRSTAATGIDAPVREGAQRVARGEAVGLARCYFARCPLCPQGRLLE